MEDVSETSGDLPEKVWRAWVAPRFLEVWGIPLALGRGFTGAEHQTGGPSAVLISDRYRRRRFAADPNVLGKTVRIGSASFPIVGVMPASFLFPDRGVDLWFPVVLSSQLRGRALRWSRSRRDVPFRTPDAVASRGSATVNETDQLAAIRIVSSSVLSRFAHCNRHTRESRCATRATSLESRCSAWQNTGG